jgi:hypothetical protein
MLEINIADNGRGRIVAQVTAGRPTTTVTLNPSDMVAVAGLLIRRMSETALTTTPGKALKNIGAAAPPAEPESPKPEPNPQPKREAPKPAKNKDEDDDAE